MHKVAIVTGSSRGIGRSVAGRLAADGVQVVVNYLRDRVAAEKLVAEIEAGGGKAVAIQADVADPGQVRSLFNGAERSFGGLDILISNAGIGRFARSRRLPMRTSTLCSRPIPRRLSWRYVKPRTGCVTVGGSW